MEACFIGRRLYQHSLNELGRFIHEYNDSPRLRLPKERFMFGLPFSTTFLVFGIPALWVLYTVVFLFLSRDWENDGEGS